MKSLRHFVVVTIWVGVGLISFLPGIVWICAGIAALGVIRGVRVTEESGP